MIRSQHHGDCGGSFCRGFARGRRESKFSHGFSPAQIQSLAAICEALVPPLSLEDTINNNNNNKEESPDDQALHSIYRASGSQPPIPDEVAELMLKRALPEVMEGMKLFLKMLSFRLGTLLLCGHRCLSWKWPFIHSFSEMSLEKREEVLKKWSKEKLVLTLRLMFLVVKIFCLYTFFSRSSSHASSLHYHRTDWAIWVRQRDEFGEWCLKLLKKHLLKWKGTGDLAKHA
ncbi:Long-chain fatty alcohol dehydrogenase family protein [Prunus dulcis]|uniref:Long-chain fatty alcohol dehydrogenase family protein n=1 Tax=Prunus dulcis TaxID=3755 RepID=A0A4Y1RQ57_PRUDU|nr:Long-chain fatty alcohol dehydrogenase family protein [Prunus dulcis]